MALLCSTQSLLLNFRQAPLLTLYQPATKLTLLSVTYIHSTSMTYKLQLVQFWLDHQVTSSLFKCQNQVHSEWMQYMHYAITGQFNECIFSLMAPCLCVYHLSWYNLGIVCVKTCCINVVPASTMLSCSSILIQYILAFNILLFSLQCQILHQEISFMTQLWICQQSFGLLHLWGITMESFLDTIWAVCQTEETA